MLRRIASQPQRRAIFGYACRQTRGRRLWATAHGANNGAAGGAVSVAGSAGLGYVLTHNKGTFAKRAVRYAPPTMLY